MKPYGAFYFVLITYYYLFGKDTKIFLYIVYDLIKKSHNISLQDFDYYLKPKLFIFCDASQHAFLTLQIYYHLHIYESEF